MLPVRALLYSGQEVDAVTLQGTGKSCHPSSRQALPSERYLKLLRTGGVLGGLLHHAGAKPCSANAADAVGRHCCPDIAIRMLAMSCCRCCPCLWRPLPILHPLERHTCSHQHHPWHTLPAAAAMLLCSLQLPIPSAHLGDVCHPLLTQPHQHAPRLTHSPPSPPPHTTHPLGCAAPPGTCSNTCPLPFAPPGARHHQVDPSYQVYLDSLRAYDSSSTQSKAGQGASLFTLLLLFGPLLPLLAAFRALSHKQDDSSSQPLSPAWVSAWFNSAVTAAWAVHDSVLVNLFGSGAENGDKKAGKQ